MAVAIKINQDYFFIIFAREYEKLSLNLNNLKNREDIKMNFNVPFAQLQPHHGIRSWFLSVKLYYHGSGQLLSQSVDLHHI